MKHLARRTFLKRISAASVGAVLVSLPAGCTTLKTAPAFSGPVKFLSVSDLHVTDEASAAYSRKVMQAMNQEGGALVLVCGDLAKDGKQTELEVARSVLDDLGMPYYPVVGNHDALYSGEKNEVLFSKTFSLLQNSYHVSSKGVHFLGISHGCGKNMRQNAVRPDVMAWITETLAAIPDDQPILLFSHYPFATGVRYRTQNASDVLALFEGKKLLAVVSGHFHGNTEKRENGILMTTTACASGRRGNHDRTKAKGYRSFHIDDQMNITTEFKEVHP